MNRLFFLGLFIFQFAMGAVWATDDVLHTSKPNSPVFFRCKFNSNTFYLLGTEHNIPYGQLSGSVRRQIERLSRLVVERVDKDELSDISYPWKKFIQGTESEQQLLDLEQICPYLDSLDGFLSTEDTSWSDLPENQELLKKLQDVGANIKLCSALKVWGLYIYLEWAFFQEAEDETHVPISNGIDYCLQDKNNLSNDIQGLESASEAYPLMYNHLQPSDILKIVEEYLEYTQSPDSGSDDDASKYQYGDLNANEKSCYKDGQEFVGAMLRNYLWLPRLLEKIGSNPNDSTLVAVGWGHLVSKHGLLNLLEKEGTIIERMNEKGDNEKLSYQPLEMPNDIDLLIQESINSH